MNWAKSEGLQNPGQSLILIGWGRIAPGGPYASTLQEAEVQLVDTEACGEAVGLVDISKVFCAGDGGRDSCQGDEGGPVLIVGTDASEDVQVGIGMSIDVCAELQTPTLSTGLQHLTEWIDHTINS